MLIPSLLASVNVKGDSSEYINLFEYFISILSQSEMNIISFYGLLIISILIFVVRGSIIFNIEKGKGFKNKKDKQNKKMYIIGHMTIELCIEYTIAYFIIKGIGVNSASYIIIFIIAPALGFLIAIIFDIKVIMKLENGMSIGIPNTSITKKSKTTDNSNNDKLGSPITVNINGNESSNKDNDNNSIKISSPLSYNDTNNKINKLDTDDASSENFNDKLILTVNNIIDIQYKQWNQITTNTNQLQNIQETIDLLRKSELIDKKLEIKSMIYKCLNKGFATPEENDNITLKYQAYRSLGGNHEIESLYENHYLKLSIHEDRRQQDSHVDIERRAVKSLLPYGEYDCDVNVIEDV